MSTEDVESKKFAQRQALKRQNFIYIAVFSILLWLSGITLLIINSYFSETPGLEGQVSNASMEAEVLAFIFMLASLVLFTVNLITNRLKNPKI